MIVALTGGIGSGKTTIAKLFETMGCVVYNSDERAKELYNNPEVKKQDQLRTGFKDCSKQI